MAEAEPTLDALRAAVQLACQSQNAGRIVAGHNQVLGMPRPWVVPPVEVERKIKNLLSGFAASCEK